MSAQTSPSELSPPARRVLAGLIVAALVLVYLEGIPAKLANPLYGFGLLAAGALLSGRIPGPAAGAGMAMLMGTGLLVVGDFTLRHTHQHLLYYRPTERLIRRLPRYPFLNGYEPDSELRVRAFGDIDAMRPPGPERVYRELHFVTDSLGFRNRPELLSSPLDMVLLGDSFVLGASVTQEETWAERLRKSHGIRAYNLAFPANPWQELLLFKVTADRLPLRTGTVLAWAIFPPNDFAGGYGTVETPTPVGAAKQWKTRLATFRNRSPLRLLTRRLWPRKDRQVQDPILEAKLPDGKPVLFFRRYLIAAHMTPETLARYPSAERIGPTLQEMKRFCGEKGLRLLVLLLPSKFEVYPELLPGEPPPRRPSAFAELVETRCREAGIEVLDLLPTFRKARSELLSKGELLYWPDDTHWNGHGTALAARALSGWWRSRTAP